MATTSMHKPGWRSRRRSRLSLVERAVPRLGRLPGPEDGQRPVRSVDAQTTENVDPSKTGVETETTTSPDVDAETPTSKTNGDARLDSVANALQALPEPSSAESDATASTPAAEMAKAASASIDPVADAKPSAAEQGRTEKAAATGQALPVARDEAAPFTSQGFEPVVAKTTSPSALAAREAVSRPLAERALPDDDSAFTDDTGGGDGAASGPALVPLAGTTISVDKSESHPTKPPVAALELDWDRLIENGFTDPRDRGRPLPKTMDPIIRALIRQALSDQSSWRDRIILVTSPNERISRTTAAINFAFGLTTVSNHRVVLVDVDTTGPGAVDRLGGQDRIGISEALADDGLEIDDLVIKTDLDRLTLVASGAPDEDILDHFASRRMLQILRYLTEAPETLLVIDAPPILVSQEAAVLNVIAGQVVLAVEAGRTTGDQIEHALQRLGDRHNVSLVLNESSGMVRDDTSRIAAEFPSAEARQKAPQIRRRLPKAAAVAGALALGLFALQSDLEARPDRTVAALAQHGLDPFAARRGQWPGDARKPVQPCRQMCW